MGSALERHTEGRDLPAVRETGPRARHFGQREYQARLRGCAPLRFGLVRPRFRFSTSDFANDLRSDLASVPPPPASGAADNARKISILMTIAITVGVRIAVIRATRNDANIDRAATEIVRSWPT